MSGQESGSRFDPTRYVRQLRGKGGAADYLDIKWRLVWLRSEHPDAQIQTEHVTITNELAIFRAVVSIPGGGSASGYGSETARDFVDFLEKAETKALGRALAALGYGTQFAQEFDVDDATDAPADARPDVLRARPVAARPETPAAARPASGVPQPAPVGRPSAPVAAPRAEAIPADSRRPTPVRPLREAEPSTPPSPPARERELERPRPQPAPARETQPPDDQPDDDGFDEIADELAPPARPAAPAAAPTRLSPPQPAPRPPVPSSRASAPAAPARPAARDEAGG